MCFQNKKTLLRSGFLNHFTDYHTHILPGVDDGIKTIEESLELLQLFEEEGVKAIVLTPHIMDEYPQNNPHFLKARFAELQGVYKGTIELRLGAEYMIDSKFGEHLQKGDLLPSRKTICWWRPPMHLSLKGSWQRSKRPKTRGIRLF